MDADGGQPGRRSASLAAVPTQPFQLRAPSRAGRDALFHSQPERLPSQFILICSFASFVLQHNPLFSSPVLNPPPPPSPACPSLGGTSRVWKPLSHPPPLPAHRGGSHHLHAASSPPDPPLPFPRERCLPTARGETAGIAGVGISRTGRAAAIAALDPDLNLMEKEMWPSTRPDPGAGLAPGRGGGGGRLQGRMERCPKPKALPLQWGSGREAGCPGGVGGLGWGAQRAVGPVYWCPVLPGTGWLPSREALPGRSEPSRTGARSLPLVTNIYICIWKLPFMPHKQFRPNI